MLSTRGAITTNVALVECAAGQNQSDKSVFLLSELEKVWVSVAVVAHRLLLDGRAVQIAPFASLWTEPYLLLRDRQQRPYSTHKLCFGINVNYANRYGIDTSKVPIEQRRGDGYVRVSMADIVAVCSVPARTASAGLKEFFMYLGEGLSRGRTFQLSLPGVATIAIKKQKAVLTLNDELRLALYERDSRKWPVEVKTEGYQVLEELAAAAPASGVASAQSSRPSSSRLSRASWRAAQPTGAPSSENNAAAAAVDGTEAKKPVFIAAAASGRTFEEIAHQVAQRHKAEQQAAAIKREQLRRQEELNRRIDHYYTYGDYHADPAWTDDGVQQQHHHGGEEHAAYEVVGADESHRRSVRPQSASGESIYNVLAAGGDSKRRSVAPLYQHHREHARKGDASNTAEPDVEVIEMIEDDESVDPSQVAKKQDKASSERETQPQQFVPPKDPELDRILREEEAFSRPISRRTAFESSAARDLIYSQPYEPPQPTQRSASSSTAPAPAQNTYTRPPTVTTTPTVAATRGQTQDDVFHYGRKRFDGYNHDGDHVGGLLRYRE